MVIVEILGLVVILIAFSISLRQIRKDHGKRMKSFNKKSKDEFDQILLEADKLDALRIKNYKKEIERLTFVLDAEMAKTIPVDKLH